MNSFPRFASVKIQIGDTVTLKPEIWREQPKASKQATTVVGFIEGIKGGIILAENLMGFRCWNSQDLQHWKLTPSRGGR